MFEIDAIGGDVDSADQGDDRRTVFVVGGGPAGLTAAYELARRPASYRVVVAEAGDRVGGIARTEDHRGYRFDIGGHRFYTKVPEVEALWHEVMGEDFIEVPRLSRIFFDGKFYSYPLKAFDTLWKVGVVEAGMIMLSYLKWKLRPIPHEHNLEAWVINRFGGRLYLRFFRSYTEKVWGMKCTEIRADWAAQRIKTLSLGKAVINALTGRNDTTSLIERFRYPRLGPGQMWETFADRIVARGGTVRLDTRVCRLHRIGQRIVAVETLQQDGTRLVERTDHVIGTMALPDLIGAIDPPPPPAVIDAAAHLRFRDFLIVTLILDTADPFPDNWIYIHSPHVQVGRIQNFRAWSAAMVPHPDHASIGMEYFCTVGDALWTLSDADLIALASAELAALGLADAASVIDGKVIRQPRAYPVYDAGYDRHVGVIRDWLSTLDNLQTVGRNGMHRYNNQDHSMLTAMLAVANIAGERHDLWNVNVERSYQEEFQVAHGADAGLG